MTLSTGSGLRRDKSLADIGALTEEVLRDGPTLSQVRMGLLASSGSFCSVRDTGGETKLSVPLHGFLNPLQVAADFGIDTRLGSSITGDITPGHNAL